MDSSLIVAGANKQRSISESEWSKELDAQEVSWASKEHRATLDDAACYSAWGPDADLHTKVLIHLAVRGAMLDAYTQPANRMKAGREHRVPLACITGAGCTGVSYANFCFLMQMSTKLCRTLHSFAEGMLVTNRPARGSHGKMAEAIGHS